VLNDNKQIQLRDLPDDPKYKQTSKFMLNQMNLNTVSKHICIIFLQYLSVIIGLRFNASLKYNIYLQCKPPWTSKEIYLSLVSNWIWTSNFWRHRWVLYQLCYTASSFKDAESQLRCMSFQILFQSKLIFILSFNHNHQ
jgi:hypothetical protein